MTFMLISCHNYFAENEDKSSVSLRDIRRFTKLQQWFKQQLILKKKIELQDNSLSQKSVKYQANAKKFNLNYFDYSKLNKNDIDLIACILALTHCYYLRISNLKDREEFLIRICQSQDQLPGLTPLKILEYLNYEQNDYILRMDLEEGIAVNLALKENIFAIIPCVMNKIAIFICGKPGCSKSMAISLVFENLKGDKSSDAFFKQLNSLIMVSFQGSDSCTSDGIIKAYDKAKKYLEDKTQNNLLPVFVFDEIGLAELSKYNPLKVLHNMLEVEKDTIAFIGISNWRLDASKMNRALYLARPDPDENDLRDTALSIYQQLCSSKDNTRILMIENLATSYFMLKQHFTQNQTEYADFYGLRDFYHLIKHVARDIQKNGIANRIEQAVIAQLAIDRNFGGKLHANEIMWKIYANLQGIEDIYEQIPHCSVRELIEKNMADKDSRYLMLIGRSDVLTYILEQQFRKRFKNSRIMVGSNLENDINKEEYGFKSLSDIILLMEKGIPIILNGMDHIESSLYDLFNQKFAISGENRFCRVALGPQLNPQCFVHQDFHCVIFIQDNDEILKSKDAPLLNRFEKHHIKLDYILSNTQKYVINEVKGWIDQLLKMRYKENNPILLNATSLFPNYSSDTLALILLNEYQLDGDIDEDTVQMIIRCKEKLIENATQDILILAKSAQIGEEDQRFIFETYNKAHKNNFIDQVKIYIDKGNDIENNQCLKMVAFTYSLRLDLSSNMDYYSYIISRRLTNFKSEAELVKTLQQFFDAKKQNVLIIETNYISDKLHLSFIKFIVDKVEQQNLEGNGWDGQKTVILLIQMQRNYNEKDYSSLPLFENWSHRVFYDINPFNQFDLSQNLLDKNIRQIIKEEPIADFSCLLGPLAEKCLLKLNFEGEISFEIQDDINDNIHFIITMLTQNQQLIKLFKDKILDSVEKQQRIIDWKDFICSDPVVINDCINVESALKKVIELNIEEYLTKILFQLEKESAFRSYFTLTQSQETNQILQKIWVQGFNGLKLEHIQLQNLSSSNYTTYFSNLQFPFIREDARMLADIITEQRKFEIENENSQNLEDEKIDYFARNFVLKSKLGENFINQLVQDRELQRIYVQDIVKIFLIENFFKPEYQKIVMIIINKMLKNTFRSFYDNLYTFLMKKQLFFSLCQVIDTFLKIKEGKNELTLINLEQIFEEALIEFMDASWEEMIRAIIDQKIIKGCYPDVQIIEEFQAFNNIAYLIEKLFRSLLTIESQLKLKNTNIIKFWSDFTTLTATLGGIHFNFLVDCSNLANNLDEVDQKQSFLDHPNFIEKILTYFEDPHLYVQNQTKLPDSVTKFMASYFTILWEINPDHLKLFIEKFDLPHYQSLYTYSSQIFQKVIKLSKITEAINNFADDLQDKIQDAELEIIQNAYQEVLEAVLNQDKDLSSKFSIAISDYLIKDLANEFSKRQDSKDEIPILIDQFNSFNYYIRLANQADRSNLIKLISNAFLKVFMNIYSETIGFIYLKEDYKLSDEMDDCLDKINNILMNNDIELVKTLQLYSLKVLKSIFQYNSSQFKEFLITDLSQKRQWMQNCEIIQAGGMNQKNPQAIDLYPFIEQIAEQEGQLMDIFEITLKTNQNAYKEQIKKIFKELERQDDFVRLGLATMKSFYLKYANDQNDTDEVCTKEFSQFFQLELDPILEQKQGKQFSVFIACLIRNFPIDNFLSLQPMQDQNWLHQRVISCYQLLLLLSNSKDTNPLTGLFFRNKGQYALANVNQSFIIGLELEYKHSYLMNLNLNYQTLRNPNGNGSYACGNNCDYVYIVQECGNVTHAAKCPWCGADIGGYQYNQPINRPGHKRMNDNDAIQLIEQLVKKYNNTQKLGYFNVNTPSEDPFLTQKGIMPISWRLMRTFIHSSLYFFITVGGSNENDFLQIFNEQQLRLLNKKPREFIEGHLQNDFKVLFKQLSSAGNDCQSAWLYSVLNEVQNVFEIYKNGEKPDNFNTTQNFFKDFDEVIVGQKTQNIAQLSQAFKQMVIQGQNRQNFKFELTIQELEKDSLRYPYLHLYRLSKEFTFEDMIASFKTNSQNDISFPLLKVCLENYTEMIKLRKLLPVIEFINYMVNKYSHMITREQARLITLSDAIKEAKEDGQIIKNLFNEFKNAWKEIGFEAEIQYFCKKNEYIKNYEETNQLNFFLIDNKELQGGMCLAAGLQELAKIQNKILKQLIDSYSKQKNMNPEYIIDHFKYPPQRIKQNHILDFNIDDETVLRLCSQSSLKYGEGQQLVYDFGRLEGNIVKDLINKKLMNEEHFQFIQYQLEVMIINGERSNFITEIRQKIPQKALDKHEKIQLEQYLADADAQNLKVLYGGLEKILCFLQNSANKNNQIDNQTIEEFCSKIQGHKEKQYSDRSVLSQIKLLNIIDLFQIIEEKYFPYITDSLKQEFFNDTKKDQIKHSLKNLLQFCDLMRDGGSALNEQQLIPPRKDLQLALMRFMIRCLAGELAHNLPLSLYITGSKEDLWDEALLRDHQQMFDNLDKLIPVDINMEDIHCCYTIISELNTAFNQNKPLAPALLPKINPPGRLQEFYPNNPYNKKKKGNIREEDVQ